MDRLTEVVFPPFTVEAGREEVTAVADTEEDPFTGVYMDTLTEVAVEALDTSVTETMTSPDEVGIELPLEVAGSELPLVETDADVFPEEVEMVLTTAVGELELETRTDDADGVTVEELAMLTEDVVWVVDTAGVVFTARVEDARAECTVAEEVTGETVHSVCSR